MFTQPYGTVLPDFSSPLHSLEPVRHAAGFT
jgi:hypothetical protein